jgi:PIN domain nuclease of toxin-antitoxin system
MSMRSRAILLDTHVAIWLMNGELSENAAGAITHAAKEEGVYVSPVTAWEIGMLGRDRKSAGPRIRFLPDSQTWFRRLMEQPGIKLAAFTADMAMASSLLPGVIHSDPADLLLIATALEMNIPIATRDRKILAYSDAGHVQAIAC